MFEKVVAAPADPILGLTEAFRADTRSHKINLGVGIYKDETGATPILHCVKQAEQKLLTDEKTKNYLGIEGNIEYGRIVQQLLFGRDAALVTSGRAKTAQAPGGTGALRIAAEFVVRNGLAKTIWISDPTWANHVSVFQAAGLSVKWYKYYDAASKGLDFAAMQASLAEVQAGDLVLLHGCCHNPAGADLDEAQWDELAELLAARGVLPFVDLAYQGLGRGLDADAYGARRLIARLPEVVVAYSCDKNFGLYRERVGAVYVLARDEAGAETVRSNLSALARVNWSMPPDHGAAIVRTVLESPELTAVWRAELDHMGERVRAVRAALAAAEPRLAYLARQQGMFSTLPIAKPQIERLRTEYAVYMAGSGRINLAGLQVGDVPQFVAALAAVGFPG